MINGGVYEYGCVWERALVVRDQNNFIKKETRGEHFATGRRAEDEI